MYLLQLLQGTKAFCSGGDQALRSKDGYADYENFGRLNVLDLQVNNSLCLNLCYGFEAKYTRKSFAHCSPESLENLLAIHYFSSFSDS